MRAFCCSIQFNGMLLGKFGWSAVRGPAVKFKVHWSKALLENRLVQVLRCVASGECVRECFHQISKPAACCSPLDRLKSGRNCLNIRWWAFRMWWCPERDFPAGENSPNCASTWTRRDALQTDLTLHFSRFVSNAFWDSNWVGKRFKFCGHTKQIS